MTAPHRHLHPGYRLDHRELVVTATETILPGVQHISLGSSTSDGVLTAFEPGSHIIVDAGGHRNAYSLVGDGVNPRTYDISVLRHDNGGGSDWLHEQAPVGTRIVVEGPRSSFAPRYQQRHALLVAGGIGVTPILSHARAAHRWGHSADILYAHRPGQAPHLTELRALASQSTAITFFEATDRTAMRNLLRERLREQPLGTHAYACGPIAMLDTYLDEGAAAGWLPSRLHLERFEAPALDPGNDFEAIIASTGTRLAVPAGVSLLQVLLDAGHRVPSLCRQGVCGECRVPIRRADALEHRDFVLTPDEQTAADALLSCVSRGVNVEVAL